MNHQPSAADQTFRLAFEACQVSPDQFDHQAHVRLAYVYLCEASLEGAADKMKAALLAFLDHLGIGQAKYHETVTRAWVMAVRHFMVESAGCDSAAAFISRNPQLGDSKIMLMHYSSELLFSSRARRSYIMPDIQAIPDYCH